MEMRRSSVFLNGTRLCCTLVLLLYVQCLQAQVPVSSYSIKNGRMFIAVGKNMTQPSLDSFITKYELEDLNLQDFIKTGAPDSLKKLGWKVDISNSEIFVISKPLFSADNISDPADKIIFTNKENTVPSSPNAGDQGHFGFNRFKNKTDFTLADSVVTFYLRGNTNANAVNLTGSFNNWEKDAIKMTKTDSGWISHVKLPPGKHLYKFIIDGNWTIDKDNLNKENDGMGNDNSVYFKPNHIFKLNGYTNARKVIVAGSFNGWNEKELLMQRTETGWKAPVYLSEGTYTYRFIADKNWFIDPANPDKLPNEFNDYNSVIRSGIPHVFRLSGFVNADKVELAGNFNNWKDNELFMIKTATGWELPYTLGPGNYEYRFKIDGKIYKPEDKTENFFLVIEPNFIFRLKGFENAKTVYISGDLNNWSHNSFKMKREGDEWIFSAHLNAGKHRYKFIVDGKWILDPGNKLWEQNEHKTGNSILWIDKN